MPQKHFYIFRHGETDYNASNRLQGQGIDASLNPKGKEQASLLASEFAGIDLDIIYTSPLKRASETAQIVADAKNIKIIECGNLKECSYGTAEGKQCEELDAKDFAQYKGISPNFKFACGETQLESATRAMTALKDIAENTDYKNIGISTHGGIIRFILSHLLNTPTELGIKNAKPYHLVYSNGQFTGYNKDK